MKVIIRLKAIPFVEPAVLQCGSQNIKLDPEKETITFLVIGEGRKRIALNVCNFMNKVFEENQSNFLDTSNLAPTLRAWFNKICLHSFRCYASESQQLFEDDAMAEGKRLVIEALGLDKPNGVAQGGNKAPTQPEELVNASEPLQVAEPVDPTTKTIRLPISDLKAVTLTIPIDLTKDEAELIANNSLEYLKALILSQHKE